MQRSSCALALCACASAPVSQLKAAASHARAAQATVACMCAGHAGEQLRWLWHTGTYGSIHPGAAQTVLLAATHRGLGNQATGLETKQALITSLGYSSSTSRPARSSCGLLMRAGPLLAQDLSAWYASSNVCASSLDNCSTLLDMPYYMMQRCLRSSSRHCVQVYRITMRDSIAACLRAHKFAELLEALIFRYSLLIYICISYIYVEKDFHPCCCSCSSWESPSCR